MSLIIMRDDRPRARDRIGPGSSWETTPKIHSTSIFHLVISLSFIHFHNTKKYMIILRAPKWIYVNSMVSIKKLKQPLQSAQSKKLNSSAAVSVWIKFMWEFFHVYSLDFFVAQWTTTLTALGFSHKVNSATIYYTNFVRSRRDTDLTCSAGQKLIFVLEIGVLYSTLSVISCIGFFWQGTSMTFSVVMWWVMRSDLTFISYFE